MGAGYVSPDHQVKRTPLKRGTKRINQMSAKRRAAAPERSELRNDYLRDNPLCVARIPGLCTRRATEVNEIQRRSAWAAGYLVRSNVEGLCHNCHGFVTDHPGYNGWAARHGHQVSRQADETEHALARYVRMKVAGHPTTCEEDHRIEAAT